MKRLCRVMPCSPTHTVGYDRKGNLLALGRPHDGPRHRFSVDSPHTADAIGYGLSISVPKFRLYFSPQPSGARIGCSYRHHEHWPRAYRLLRMLHRHTNPSDYAHPPLFLDCGVAVA